MIYRVPIDYVDIMVLVSSGTSLGSSNRVYVRPNQEDGVYVGASEDL